LLNCLLYLLLEHKIIGVFSLSLRVFKLLICKVLLVKYSIIVIVTHYFLIIFKFVILANKICSNLSLLSNYIFFIIFFFLFLFFFFGIFFTFYFKLINRFNKWVIIFLNYLLFLYNNSRANYISLFDYSPIFNYYVIQYNSSINLAVFLDNY